VNPWRRVQKPRDVASWKVRPGVRGPGPGLVDVTTLRYIVEGPVAILPAKVAVLIEVVDVDPCRHWPIPPPPEWALTGVPRPYLSRYVVP
jgi:hypothetical protein